MKLKWIALFLCVLAFTINATAETRPDEPQRLTVEKRGAAVAQLSGSGNQTTRSFQLKAATATFGVRLNWEKLDPSLSGNEGNFSVTLVDANEKPVEVVIATIDHFDGARSIEIPADGTYTLKVIAPGSWDIEVQQ